MSRAEIYNNMNVYFDPQGKQTLLLKERNLFFFSLGSWTITQKRNIRVVSKYLITVQFIYCRSIRITVLNLSQNENGRIPTLKAWAVLNITLLHMKD